MAEKDKTIENLSENINTYDKQIRETIEKTGKRRIRERTAICQRTILTNRRKNANLKPR